MVEALKEAAENWNKVNFTVIMDKVDSLKLPKSGAEKLTDKVHTVWQEILHSVELWAIVPVDPDELKELAKVLRDKKERKKRIKNEEAFTQILFETKRWPKEGDKPLVLSSHEIVERNSIFIRNLLLSTPKVPGLQFRQNGQLLWCMFLYQGQEILFLKREIAEHPITSWEFISYVRRKHKKLFEKNKSKKQS